MVLRIGVEGLVCKVGAEGSRFVHEFLGLGIGVKDLGSSWFCVEA